MVQPFAANLMQCIAINLENSASSILPSAHFAASSKLKGEVVERLQGPANIVVGLIGTTCQADNVAHVAIR